MKCLACNKNLVKRRVLDTMTLSCHEHILFEFDLEPVVRLVYYSAYILDNTQSIDLFGSLYHDFSKTKRNKCHYLRPTGISVFAFRKIHDKIMKFSSFV